MDDYADGGAFRYEGGGGIERLAEVTEAKFSAVLVINSPGAGDRRNVNGLRSVHCIPRSCSRNHNRHAWHASAGASEGFQGSAERSAGKPARKIWLDYGGKSPGQGIRREQSGRTNHD
jgi:hypothetical protein